MNFPNNIAIILPSYKAEVSLTSFLPKLIEQIPASQIYVVNDGVFDDTKKLSNSLNVNYIEHPVNRGKGAALTTGFSQIDEKFEWAITIDADGQHDISDLSKFLEIIDKNRDVGVVVGSRSRKIGEMPLARIFSNSSTSAALSILCGQKVEDSQCGYRAYSRKLFSIAKCKYNRFEMESEVLLIASSLNFKILSVPIKTIYGDEESSISHFKDTARWIWAVSFTSIKLFMNKRK